MDLLTADAIIAHHNNLRSWPQAFKFATSHGLVDLSVSIGDNASTPTNVSMYQPSVYPSWRCHRPVYRFDPNCYSGAEAEKQLVYDVRRSLLGVNFFANNSYDTNLHRTVRLVCSFSKTLSKTTLYKDEYFTRVDTKLELMKRSGSSTFDRLDNSKLKRKKKKKTS